MTTPISSLNRKGNQVSGHSKFHSDSPGDRLFKDRREQTAIRTIMDRQDATVVEMPLDQFKHGFQGSRLFDVRWHITGLQEYLGGNTATKTLVRRRRHQQ